MTSTFFLLGNSIFNCGVKRGLKDLKICLWDWSSKFDFRLMVNFLDWY